MSSGGPEVAAGARRPELSVDDCVSGVRAGDRAVLARAITLVESTLPAHQERAQEVLDRLHGHTGGAHRVGITGVPGVGKSTFVERLGRHLTERGRRVAVLAIDPSSSRTGGSILGDKTRMPTLAADPAAFVRPSPSSGTLGGVARKTRETLLLCEAAGFDVVFVETVGVGQSETLVGQMVDFFLALMLAGAGDELQGIKRGLLELVHMLAINKADGDDRERAQRAAADYQAAIRTLHPRGGTWLPPVVTVSALLGEGIAELWEQVLEHRRRATATGEWAARRRAQQVRWMWSLVEDQLHAALRAHPAVNRTLETTEQAVEDGSVTPERAARSLLAAFGVPSTTGDAAPPAEETQ